MRSFNFIIILVTALMMGISIQSCIDLRDSDFFPDDIDGRLPAYSEKGYDIAGALLNNNTWRAERMPFSELMLIDISKTDTMVFEMYGRMIDGERKDDFVEFHLSQTGIKINSFSDLKKLEGKTIFFRENNFASLIYTPKNKFPFSDTNGTGQLIFKSIREIKNQTYINNSNMTLFHSHPIYLSGTFELSFKDSLEIPLKIEKGRFDFKAYFKLKQ